MVDQNFVFIFLYFSHLDSRLYKYNKKVYLEWFRVRFRWNWVTIESLVVGEEFLLVGFFLLDII